jgi:hypothetical protein
MAGRQPRIFIIASFIGVDTPHEESFFLGAVWTFVAFPFTLAFPFPFTLTFPFPLRVAFRLGIALTGDSLFIVGVVWWSFGRLFRVFRRALRRLVRSLRWSFRRLIGSFGRSFRWLIGSFRRFFRRAFRLVVVIWTSVLEGFPAAR